MNQGLKYYLLALDILCVTYVSQKVKPLPNDQKIALNRIKACQ